MKKKTTNGIEIDWCICHPYDGSQPEVPPGPDTLMGICAECDKNGRGDIYLRLLAAKETPSYRPP